MIIPDKLPRVTGRGSLSRAFGLTFGKINELIDVVKALQVRPTINSKVTQTMAGTTVEPTGGAAGTEAQKHCGPARYS